MSFLTGESALPRPSSVGSTQPRRKDWGQMWSRHIPVLPHRTIQVCLQRAACVPSIQRDFLRPCLQSLRAVGNRLDAGPAEHISTLKSLGLPVDGTHFDTLLCRLRNGHPVGFVSDLKVKVRFIPGRRGFDANRRRSNEIEQCSKSSRCVIFILERT